MHRLGYEKDNSIGRRIRLIVNGRFATDEGLHKAVDDLRSAGLGIDVRVTWEKGDAERFAARAMQEGIEAVVAAGGDGTLGEVVNGVFANGPPTCAIGIVPLGTANDFAGAFGLMSEDPYEALQLIARGTPRQIDVGRIDERYFINVASGGFGAEITTQTSRDAKSLLGRASYLLTGLAQIRNIEPHPVRLEGPGFSWEGPTYVLAIGNGRQAGGGFQVCPEARLDDGLLDLLVIPELPGLEILTLLDDLLRGTLPSQDHVVYQRLTSLHVESKEEIQFNLDGEPHCGHTFQFEVQPASLPFFLPPEINGA